MNEIKTKDDVTKETFQEFVVKQGDNNGRSEQTRRKTK